MAVWIGASVKEREFLASTFPEIHKYKLALLKNEHGLILGAASLDDMPRCTKCCWGDRCDNWDHYYRPECPDCLGTGINQAEARASSSPDSPPETESPS